MSYLKNKRALFDISLCLLNLYVSIGIFIGNTDNTPENPRAGAKSARVIQAIVSIMIWTKSLYYMRLVDELAPLVSIIFKIFYDIRFFVVTLTIGIFAFANAFYLIGKNQI